MSVIVETRSGRLEGLEADGVASFKGVPYAAPPTGALRWQPPQPPAAWDGVRAATAFGNAAAQLDIAPEHAATPLGALLRVHEPLDEDCLYLNVWTPAADAGKRPVMVWIHGGAFELGAGSQALYDGRELARRGDVVVVTINYRMGPFGFLRLVDATAGDVPATGSEGLLDMVAALEWVRDNIDAFGGDGSSVTLFGESAGGIAIAGLLCTPRARGLFSRAIVQSGPPIARGIPEANALGDRVLQRLGVGRGRDALLAASTADILGAMPTMAEVGASGNAASVFGFVRPWLTADGDVLPGPVLDAVAAGSAAGVALLAGSTRDEMRGAMPPDASAGIVQGLLGTIFPGIKGGDWSGLIERYRKARLPRLVDGSTQLLAAAMHTDLNARIPTIRLLERQRPHGAVYHYVFTWTSPQGDGTAGAPHGGEIGFVFGTYDQGPAQRLFFGAGPAAAALAEAVQDAWVAFARNGDPSCPALGEWPAYDDTRATMLIGEFCGIERDPWAGERMVWERYADEALIPAYLR